MPDQDADQPYHHIFEAMGDGLILNDGETGLVVEANPAAAAMHGYSRQEFVGLPPAAYLHPDSLDQFGGWLHSALAGVGFEAIAVHRRRDGAPFTVVVRGTGCTYRQRPCLLSVIRDAHLYEQMQTLAALEERQRLAQNLHDAVNQSLFSASLIAEVLPRLWETHPDAVRESLEDLRRLTRGALAEMRGLLVELRPLVLADSELDDLLRLLGDALTGRTGIPVTVTVVGEGELPAEVQMALYRLCQEALNNIAKHSEAGEVAIQLHYDGAAVSLSIHDNGRGFNPEHIPSGHYGLDMMEERARAVGAALTITSRPGQGTEIAAVWKVTPEQ